MQEANASSMNAIVLFFLLMAILIAIVGAVGLAGTMSMNVLERTREIGVMRAIGATNRAVAGIVLVEGTLVGFLSWALGSLLSIPIARAMFAAVSQALFKTSAPFSLSHQGFVLWLVVSLVLSAVASWLPARNASRLTIRETLAYE